MWEDAISRGHYQVAEVILNIRSITKADVAVCARYPLGSKGVKWLFSLGPIVHGEWESFLIDCIEHGQVNSFVAAMDIARESCRFQFPFTPLHYAALTAEEVEDLPEPIDEETTNEGATSNFFTPVHLAALNPQPRILKHLMENGGDATLLDHKYR